MGNKSKINEVINEQFGLKKYDKYYDDDDLINLYDKNEIKDNILGKLNKLLYLSN